MLFNTLGRDWGEGHWQESINGGLLKKAPVITDPHAYLRTLGPALGSFMAQACEAIEHSACCFDPNVWK